MSAKNRLNRALDIYSQNGLKNLFVSILKYARNVIRGRYVLYVNHILEYSGKEIESITLNGVDIPVEKYSLDYLFPFYTYPYPTEDNPSYEHNEVGALREYGSKTDDVVVIGGGIGVTAVIAAIETGGDVIVYEQSKDSCEIINRAIQKNDLTNQINVIQAAVGRKAGANHAHKLSSDIDTIQPTDLPNADIYEIDCEGAELEILKNMTIRPSKILVETHYNHDEVEAVLRNKGYSIAEVVDDHLACTHIRAIYDN